MQQIPLYLPIDLATTEISSPDAVVSKILPRSGSASWGPHARKSEGGAVSFGILGDRLTMGELSNVVLNVVLRSGRQFSWSTFQLSRNVPSRRHADEGIKEFLAMVVGKFDGGVLRCDGRADLDMAGPAVFFELGAPCVVEPLR